MSLTYRSSHSFQTSLIVLSTPKSPLYQPFLMYQTNLRTRWFQMFRWFPNNHWFQMFLNAQTFRWFQRNQTYLMFQNSLMSLMSPIGLSNQTYLLPTFPNSLNHR